mmetsp:Transcript_136654/g.193275  ORF Transcript_136654/g.193275 Transcript_136654/m.193275 type:complete len:202 (+) Transcript_136654:113-718(+)
MNITFTTTISALLRSPGDGRVREASQPHFTVLLSHGSHHHTTTSLDIGGIDPGLLLNLQGILSEVGLVAPPSIALELPLVGVPWFHRWLMWLSPLDVLGHEHPALRLCFPWFILGTCRGCRDGARGSAREGSASGWNCSADGLRNYRRSGSAAAYTHSSRHTGSADQSRTCQGTCGARRCCPRKSGGPPRSHGAGSEKGGL